MEQIENKEKVRKWYVIPLFILFGIILISASITAYYFLVHSSGKIVQPITMSDQSSFSYGNCYAGQSCDSRNLTITNSGNQQAITIYVGLSNGIENITLTGLSINNQYNDSSNYYFNVLIPSGTSQFYVTLFPNKYATNNSAILSDIGAF